MRKLLFVLAACLSCSQTYSQEKAKISKGDTRIYTAVEQQPQFGNDEAAFSKYIMKNVRYIASDTIGHNIESRFIATFVVEKNGELSHIKLLKPTWNSATGRSFLKALKQSPRWQPGIQNGYYVRVQYTIPLTMCLGSE